MRKHKYLLAIFIVIIFSTPFSCTNKNNSLHKELVRRAIELNKSAPAVLDKHTRFDSVGVSTDNVFSYYYTITSIDNPKELISSQKREMIEQMDKMYISDKSLQFFVKNSVTMKYIYRDTAQNIVDVITIDTANYNKQKVNN